jgi:L,D-transpeptidase YbiS
MRIIVSVAKQTLQLWRGSLMMQEWPCSTSRYGLGFAEGSLRTPLGRFIIREKHGADQPWGTVFKARQPVALWRKGEDSQEDLVLTRILRLDGLQVQNANTFDRYIYIHGTNDEQRIGQRGSHGCIRLKNDDVISLYDLVPEGTEVWIEE